MHIYICIYIYIYIYICSIVRDIVTYWIIYKQNKNIKRNCDTLIQQNDNKTTIAFEHSCVLPQCIYIYIHIYIPHIYIFIVHCYFFLSFSLSTFLNFANPSRNWTFQRNKEYIYIFLFMHIYVVSVCLSEGGTFSPLQANFLGK